MDPEQFDKEVMETINERAEAFANDNLKYPTDYEIMFIKNAMIIGASIFAETMIKSTKGILPDDTCDRNS